MYSLVAVTTTVHIDSTILAMAMGTVIPVLVQLVTKLRAAASTRAMLQAMLAAIAGVGATAATHGGDLNWQNALLNVGLAWTVAIATHFGLLVPTGLALRIARKTARVGIGTTQTPEPPTLLPPAATGGRPATTTVHLEPAPADVGQVTMTPDNTAEPVYITHPPQPANTQP